MTTASAALLPCLQFASYLDHVLSLPAYLTAEGLVRAFQRHEPQTERRIDAPKPACRIES
jgi:hypothetical protein